MNELSVVGSAAPKEVSASLYRAYLKGAYDALQSQPAERDNSLKAALAAMTFGFLCWVAMLFFVFKS